MVSILGATQIGQLKTGREPRHSSAEGAGEHCLLQEHTANACHNRLRRLSFAHFSLDWGVFLAILELALRENQKELPMNRNLQKCRPSKSVYDLCKANLHLIGTWLLHSRKSTLARLFYDEKFFFREILEFG